MTNPVLALVVVLVASPVLVLLLHIILHRLLSLMKPETTGHGSAIVAIGAGGLLVAAVAWTLLAATVNGDLLEILAGAAYVGVVYGAMSLLYVNAVNIAETSLHMHTLLEVAWGEPLAERSLMAKYSADKMIAARLERLTSLGQIRPDRDRYVLGSRSLLRFAEAVDAWRRLIGVPVPEIMSERETK